jgi:hypothetical protein
MGETLAVVHEDSMICQRPQHAMQSLRLRSNGPRE